jgi:hypothetical protein
MATPNIRREARWPAPIRTKTNAFFGIVAATLLACSDSSQPTGLEAGSTGLRGSWMLVAVDGQPLPARIDDGAEIVAGELELSAGGSYWTSTHATIFGAPFNDWWEGRWSVAGDRLVLERSGQAAVFVGTWSGSTIEIAGTRTMRYARPSTRANPTTSSSPTRPSRSNPR